MNITKLEIGLLKSNCYLISSEKAAICIDPGYYDERIRLFFEENSDKQRMILLTHTHFDHVGAAERLRSETGVKIAIGRIEEPSLHDPAVTLSDRFHAHIAPFGADKTIDDGEKFSVGDLKISAILTPGHTIGGMCYLINGNLFSGDTLFAGTIGNTTHPGGDGDRLLRSVEQLAYMLPDETPVYPGHGKSTDMGTEKRTNPFLREL